MRTLMIAAATAAALMAGIAYAEGTSSSGRAGSPSPSAGSSSDRTYDNSLQPNYRSGSSGSTSGTSPLNNPGTSGSSGNSGYGQMGTGSSSQGSPSTAPLESDPRSPANNQTGTGTHCPPGRPNCGPDGG